MARKTINVDSVRIFVNDCLKNDNIPFEVKNGMSQILDHILHETDNYRGFNYLDSYDDDDSEFNFVQTKEGFLLSGPKAIRRRYN